MFNENDIAALRESLPEIDLHSVSAQGSLAQRYFDYYGLNLSSDLIGVSHHFGRFSAADFQIACHYFSLPSAQVRGTVFIVHGYYDHSGLYTHLIRYFLEHNVSVMIFDLPGHGMSSGQPASIDSFSQYRDVLDGCLGLAQQAQLPQPWHLLGQSTGSAIIMDHCLRHCDSSRQQFANVVLLAPLVRPYRWWFGSALHFVLEPFVTAVKRNFAQNSNDTEFLQFVKESDPLQSHVLPSKWVRALKNWMPEFARSESCAMPIVVIQGTDDTTVDWRYNMQAIEHKFPNASIQLVADARHHLANESPEIMAQVYAVLDKLLLE